MLCDVVTSFTELISTISLQVIEETLSPTWDESMVFEEVLVYGRREDIKANPPIIIVETYDQDKVRASDIIIITSSSLYAKVGKAEFLGRATARPHVYLEEEVSVCSESLL